MKREKFGSRLGFILISAGCAIGLGNVWRFPYITGKYGGAAFVLIYLLFLVLLGLPIMVMEFAVGRGSQASIALSFDRLEPLGTKWHWYKWFGIGGNYLLMMFYTTIGGWLLLYTGKMAIGEFKGLDADGVTGVFTSLLGQPVTMTICMILVVVLCFGIVCMGLQKGVEQITKKMMILLFVLMIILAVRSVTLPGAEKGLEFYLLPDFKKAAESGLKEVIFAAMGQAFFTLSLGIGAIAIFGSYIGKERTLTGEAVCVTVLDTLVALIAGFIIFPACFAFNVQPDSGPSLIFITLPNIFNAMSGGRIWGTIFFLCMLFAACSTIIAVFDNLIAFVDNNNLQLDGSLEEVMSPYPIGDKFKAFGWNVIEIDGHDVEQIADAVELASVVTGKPTAIVAHTIKGKGVSLFENNVDFHGGQPKPEQWPACFAELDARLAELED